MTNTHTGKAKIDQAFIDDAADTIEKAIAKIESLEADKRRQEAREKVLTAALNNIAALCTVEPKPVYDDSMGWDWLTDDTDDIYWGGVEVGKFECAQIARTALHPSDDHIDAQAGGIGIK